MVAYMPRSEIEK